MTAVGKLNPNSTIKEYVQDLRAAQLSPTSESDKVCMQIADILPREEYLAWVDAGPESNAAFLKYAQDKLQALTTARRPFDRDDADILAAARKVSPNAVLVGDLTRAAYMEADENIGTRVIVSGGEVMELDSHLEASYEERTEEDMPF